ncbi:unnamed protein product [Parascedosporium putredinis]|uniref:Protein kinase domain-containing protein n=1 Tax=Parascedosporium putredinis TaxID=1442378 RepID=A0A9P1H471_9PEZI|nr:unnamed protein product [Parascedosporium putredinis]CAI7996325.1 unnamed protein product [Parascedosporium putredinis]
MNEFRALMSQHQRKGLKNRDFIPQLLFNSAVTKAVIRDGVSTVPDYVYQAKTLADTIASTGKKVFGILLLNDQMDLLLKFVEADYLDAKLPFSVASLTKVVGLSDDEAGLFEQAQWGLISPTFRLCQKKFVLDKFAGEENNLDKDQVEEDYLKELHNFSILNHLKHPNIIELLASYTLNGKHNLLFPLAKDGTLQKLLKTEREKTPFTSDATLLIALAGLASAVEHVHHFAAERLELKLMGCHHDLRPRNILVSGSTLILADFGLSNFIEVSDDPEPLVYTAKTRDPEDMFKLPKGTPPYKTMDLFDSIIDCLKRLRSDLERRLSETETREHLDFSGLIHLNDELESFLSVEQNNASRRYFNIRIMDDSEQASTQWESGGTSGSISRDIRKRRAIKNMNRQIDKSHTSKSKKLLVNSEDVKLVRQVNHHDLGRLLADSAESQIWIEWRKYEKSGTDGALTEKLQQRTAAVAEFLAEPKPESFRTLKCRGYFHEPRRTSFGLIFELPEGRNADRLSNLNQEILRTCSSKTIADRPDLDDRYKLASSLAATVLNLHTAGWLHKSLMPSNIVFFPNASERSGALVRNHFWLGLITVGRETHPPSRREYLMTAREITSIPDI